MDLEPVLRLAADDLSPDEAELERAERSYDYLWTRLNNGNMEARILAMYKSGSFARGTALGPLDDIDIICVIDPAYWRLPFFHSRPNPAAVIDTFARAVRDRYPSRVSRQRRSIRLHLNHVKIDIVPAIEPDDEESEGLILVPDREDNDWILSGPTIHTALVDEVDAESDGRFRQIARLLKNWNHSLPANTSWKSFAIETLALALFRQHPLETLEEGIVDFFDHALFSGGYKSDNEWKGIGVDLSEEPPSVPDLAESGSNTAERVDGDCRERFLAKLELAARRFSQAQVARTDDNALNYLEQSLGLTLS